MSRLGQQTSRVTGFEGDVIERTTHTTDTRPAGLKTGSIYVNPTTKEEFIYDGTQWRGSAFTTSTSTSTSTTSTSTSTTTS